jgi:hypothetical protein
MKHTSHNADRASTVIRQQHALKLRIVAQAKCNTFLDLNGRPTYGSWLRIAESGDHWGTMGACHEQGADLQH